MMPFGLPDHWILKLRAWAAQKPEIREVWIFGSRSRGDYKPNSDVDIALKINGDTPGDKDGIYICEAEVWREEIQQFTSVPVDLDQGDEDCDSEIVVPALEREGKRVFP